MGQCRGVGCKGPKEPEKQGEEEAVGRLVCDQRANIRVGNTECRVEIKTSGMPTLPSPCASLPSITPILLPEDTSGGRAPPTAPPNPHPSEESSEMGLERRTGAEPGGEGHAGLRVETLRRGVALGTPGGPRGR